jgi:hypothetical protein
MIIIRESNRNNKKAPKIENGITLITIKMRFDTIKFKITNINDIDSLLCKKSPDTVPS